MRHQPHIISQKKRVIRLGIPRVSDLADGNQPAALFRERIFPVTFGGKAVIITFSP
jgi:hypothetical protein